jgi:hypothetical protein
LPITCVSDVQMAHARPFSTSKLQDLSNGIKNTSRQGVLPSVVELWSCGSPRGLQVPTFGSVSLILTLAQSGVATFLANLMRKARNMLSPMHPEAIIRQRATILHTKGNVLLLYGPSYISSPIYMAPTSLCISTTNLSSG